MRPPGGPPTRGTVLPTSTAVEENGGKQGLVEVRSSLRELTVLLEPQSDHEGNWRCGRPGLRGLIAVRIRPPVIRAVSSKALESLDGAISFFAELGLASALQQRFRGNVAEPARELGVGRPNAAVRTAHLVECRRRGWIAGMCGGLAVAQVSGRTVVLPR